MEEIKQISISSSNSEEQVEMHNYTQKNLDRHNLIEISPNININEKSVNLLISGYTNSWDGYDIFNPIHVANKNISQSDSLSGFSYMLIGVVALSIMHILNKLLFYSNPNLTNFDTQVFVGLVWTPLFAVLALRNKVELNILNLEAKSRNVVIWRCLAGYSMNLLFFKGMQFISVGETMLIINFNPLCWIFLSYFILEEWFKWNNFIFALGALFGIYILSMNKDPIDIGNENKYLGYLMIFGSAWCSGIVFVWIRWLNIYKINFFIAPFYLGLTSICTTIIIYIYSPSLIYLDHTWIEVLTLIINGFAAFIAHLSFSYAFKFQLVSRLSPWAYLENIITLLADVVLFNYYFIISDYIGIVILAWWLGIPIILNWKGWIN